MQQRVAKAQLKWQLAEVGSYAIAGKRQSVASVPHQMGSQERLRSIVGIREQHLGSPHECVEHGSMRVPKMSSSSLSLANRIAPSQMKQDEEFQPGDPNLSRNVDEGSHLEALPKYLHLDNSMDIFSLNVERR